MAELTDLADLIYDNQPDLFLQTYLELLIQGFTLAIPIEQESRDTRAIWVSIISKIENDFEEEFIDKITHKWTGLIKRYQGEIDNNSAEKLFELLTGTPYQKSEAKPNVDNSFYTRNMDPLKAPREEVVSPFYYKQLEIEKSTPPPKEELAKRRKKSIKQGEIDTFLIYHLSFARHNELPKIPISSMLESIKSQWEEILLNDFNINLNDDVLEELCSRWFYLVNQKGLPNTIEKVKKILYSIMAEHPELEKTTAKAPTEKKAKKKGFFSKLIGRS